jgi:glycosyltransferase involved in cell wall biosynthesis
MEIQISVVVTCYNEARFIGETIESIMTQSRIETIKEIVITDDGSKDNSKAVIMEKAKLYPIVKYVYQENAGLPSARNTSIAHCSGNYIAICDGDDLWEENKIAVQLEYITRYPQVGLFYCDFYKYQYEIGKLIPMNVNQYHHDTQNLLQKFLAKGGPIVPSGVIIKKECFDVVGLFDPVFRMAEDTDMWLRIATKYPFQHIDQYLLKKREVKNSLGANTIKNAVYYKMAFDKIEQLEAGLEPFRKKRDAIISYKLSWYYYRLEEYKNAINAAKKGINANRLYPKNYIILLATYFKKVFQIDLMNVIK